MTGKIYKIVNTSNNKIYIGSTFQQRLSWRMGQHRACARHIELKKTSLLYTHMRKVGIHRFSIVLLRIVDTDDKDELHKAEFEEIKKRNKKRLLNMNLEMGKHGKEHSKKVGDAQRGSKSHAFNRGSIMRLTKMQQGYPLDMIAFRWFADGKQHSKSWSIKKFGLERAMKNAKAMRNTVYPKEY